MTRSFIITKITKVIESCTSKDQLVLAHRYCLLLMQTWLEQNKTDYGFGEYRLFIGFINDKLYYKGLELNENL
jgi:hypothetical protein